MKIKKVCRQCGKEFERYLSAFRRNKANYCSRKCFYMGHSISPGNLQKMLDARKGKINPWIGRKHKASTIEKMRFAKFGKTWEEIYGNEEAEKKRIAIKLLMMGRPVSIETREKISLHHRPLSKESIEKMRQTIINQFKNGRRAPRIYGRIPVNKGIRTSPIKICPICQIQFRKKNSGTIYCSMRCMNRSENFQINRIIGLWHLDRNSELDQQIIRAKVLLFNSKRRFENEQKHYGEVLVDGSGDIGSASYGDERGD